MLKPLKHKLLIITAIYLVSVFPLIGQSSSLHPVKRGSKFGYANDEGRMVITAKYAIAMEFGEGLAYVSEAPDRHGSWKHGFIDQTGRWVAFLDGKSFRPASGSEAGQMGYGERHDQVVFSNGFVELPAFNSTGGQDFEISSVWLNRNQMIEQVERYGRETPLRPTSRVFYSQLTESNDYILGKYAKARNTKGPNGTFTFSRKGSKPVTSTMPGEENRWFGSFGTMRYTGNTYLVYTSRNQQVRYFDEVTVLERSDGWVGFIAKSLSGQYMLYKQDITTDGYETYETVGDFMKKHQDYSVKNSSDEEETQREFMSRKLLNFHSLQQMENHYLVNDATFDKSKTPVCVESKAKALSEVRIALQYGTLMLTDYSAGNREAWLWNFSTNSKIRVKFPLHIDANGNKGNDGESGSDGASGRPKLTYKQDNVTKTEPGTCGEAGGDGKDGERGQNGATLLIIMDKSIPAGEVTFSTKGGAGGKAGKGGTGGIHGVGSPCSGKAKDGKSGKDGAMGTDGKVRIVND